MLHCSELLQNGCCHLWASMLCLLQPSADWTPGDDAETSQARWLPSLGGEMLRHWLCSHRLESRSERRFGSRSKMWLGSWFEIRAFTCIANAFPITIRICALRGNILLLLRSPRALIDPCALLMHGFSAHFLNAHARITFQKSFAFTCPRIRLSRRITIQNAPFFAFQNAFQKPDLKQLCVHKD